MSKSRLPFFTDSIKRFTIWNVSLFLLILLLFNIFLIFIIQYVMHENIDNRLRHEIENVVASLQIDDSTITVIDFKEFNEPDLTQVTETPYFLQIYNSEGQVLIESRNISLYKTIPPETGKSYPKYFFKDFKIEDDNLRAGYISLYNPTGNELAVLRLTTIEKKFQNLFNDLIKFNLISLPILILIIIAASVFLAKRSFAPVNKIIETAENISAKNLNARIDYDAKKDDELGRLRDTLNNLFNRIELHVEQLSQFTDHASHQLMNPLTAVKTELEYIMKKERTTREYKETLNKLLVQTDHMIEIVKTLLLISKQDQLDNSSKQIFNLKKLIAEKIKPVYKEKEINFKLADDIYVRGDIQKFNIIIQNLIDNAIKYSDDGGEIIVELEKNSAQAIIKITDFGIGISDEEKKKVFDRFYRSEKAEKYGIKGFGLGLSLVKTLISEAGGIITLHDNHPKGTTAKIVLPAVQID